MGIQVGLLKERLPGERRVALVPAGVAQLVAAGMSVRIEAGAGLAAGFPDEAYRGKGGEICPLRQDVLAASLLVGVRHLGAAEPLGREALADYRPGQFLVGLCDPLAAPQTIALAAEKGLRVLALELIPRISRAQSMDVLSSMATVAGYRAVLLAATHLPRMFPMLMTAAGTITAARLFVIGAGVAGLQAIATARRLGAIVEGYDLRPAVRDQVESLGARFVELPLAAASAETAGGYARAMDEEFYRRQRDLLAAVVARSDVVITTAAVPGKKAPVLITAEMVAGMPAGAVLVDLAAERGGNCELTRPDQVVQAGQVTVLGPTNAPADVPQDASFMFSRNVANYLIHLARTGELAADADDPITRETLVTRDGQVVHHRIRELLGLPPWSERGGKPPEQPAGAVAQD